MKRFLTFILLVFGVICAQPGCGCDSGENADLVFVNQSGATIVAVVVNFEDQSGGQQYADGSPLKRGETFGFEAGEYPVTVAAYDSPFEGLGQKELGHTTIQSAPPEGTMVCHCPRRSGGPNIPHQHPIAGPGRGVKMAA